MTTARTYLDHNATSPLRPEARAAMLAVMEICGNPSSVHGEGRRARAVVETAREQVAELVNARPSEVIFTSGATEANNWVIASRQWGAILASPIEHDSVTAALAPRRTVVCDLAIDREGRADPATIERFATDADGRPRLMLLQAANNETGIVQPVADAGLAARRAGVWLHSDAVQLAGKSPLDFARLGADSLALSAHKIGGPAGVGALIVREGAELEPLVRGGGQERRRRAGTENVVGIAGFGAAAVAASRELGSIGRIERLRDDLERQLTAASPHAVIVGQGAARLPNTTCVALPGTTAELLVIRLDLAGVAVSAGAACSSGKVSASRALTAMALPPDVVRGAIRISLGWSTVEADIEAMLVAWKSIAGARAAA